ncbi:MAG: recombinase family protein [Bacilli bacterium]|nr:recombinase family protein [Bacilli bacterium]
MNDSNKEIMVGIYVRVSTEDQKEHGYSIPQQIDILTELADYNNWVIHKVYNDAGISGKSTDNRPMLKELIKDIKKGMISKVLITKLDRLSRNVADTETLLNIFNSFNCELLDGNGKKIESDNPSGWLFTIIQSVFGQYERKSIISRVKEGIKGKVKQGKSLCSFTPPYGYDRENGKPILSVNEEEAAIVRKIYSMYLDGYTFTEIARILNAERIKTKLRGKKIKRKDHESNLGTRIIISKWMPKTIRLILSNSTYIGKVRYHINKPDYQEYDGHHEPIIDAKTYNQVQDKIKQIKKVYRTNRPKEDVYYCGTLICGLCNKKMTTQRTVRKVKGKNSIVYFGYRCINREKGTCSAKSISHKKVEKKFLEYIDKKGVITEIDEANIQINENVKIEEIDILSKEINKLNIKKEEVMNLFIDNIITHNQMQYMVKELNKKEKLLKQRLNKFKLVVDEVPKRSLKNISTNIKEHWGYLTNRERFGFLNQFVEKIVIINKNNDRINREPEILEVSIY